MIKGKLKSKIQNNAIAKTLGRVYIYIYISILLQKNGIAYLLEIHLAK